MIPLGHVFKELFTERTRVLLTILAIAWGTASITTMLALGEGLRLTFSRSGKGMGEDILIAWPGQTSKPYGGLPEGHPVPLNAEDLNQIRASIPEIGGISGEYRHYAGMRYGDNLRTGRLMGVHPAYGPMRNIILEQGSRFIDPIDTAQRRRVAVIGPQVAEELFGEGIDPVGLQIAIEGRPFTVVGLMKKKYQMSTYGGPDRDGTWIPISTFETIYNRRHYNNLVVKPHDRSDMEYVKTRMREVIANRHGCDPTDEEITNNWDTSEGKDIAIGILYGLQAMLGIIGGLTLIVAGVGIANVMYVSVSNANAWNRAHPNSKPLEITPVLRGMGTLPLDQSDDWMARMQYQKLRETLIRSANENWKSDIHGMSPTPGIAYGAQFGKPPSGSEGPY
ncbi:MAG: ABC transporter permease [Gemmatimonadetes bacterium]|nr:ABC transporter permease [Gemmatimonadota bacterium]